MRVVQDRMRHAAQRRADGVRTPSPLLKIARQRTQPTVRLSAVTRSLVAVVAHGASVVTRARRAGVTPSR